MGRVTHICCVSRVTSVGLSKKKLINSVLRYWLIVLTKVRSESDLILRNLKSTNDFLDELVHSAEIGSMKYRKCQLKQNYHFRLLNLFREKE